MWFTDPFKGQYIWLKLDTGYIFIKIRNEIQLINKGSEKNLETMPVKKKSEEKCKLKRNFAMLFDLMMRKGNSYKLLYSEDFEIYKWY